MPEPQSTPPLPALAPGPRYLARAGDGSEIDLLFARNQELERRNLELARSNNDLLNLLANVQVAIVMIAPDLRIRRFTPLAGKTLGLGEGDVGRVLSEVDLGLGIPDLGRIVVEVMDTVRPRELEVRDRHGFWQSLRVRPYRSFEKPVDGAVLVLVEVDTLKREQQTVQRQADLLDQAQEPILMWDLDGGITYWNRAAEVVYGFTAQEALGRASYDLLQTRDPGRYLAALRSDGRWSGELRQTRRDGAEIVVESRLVLAQGEPGLVIETNVPITARKALEEDLRGRLEELARADASKNEFMAMLTHELRGPLAPLRNALQILRTPGLDEAAREATRAMMERQVATMSRIVDDLLDISLVTQNRLTLEPRVVEIGGLLAALVGRFAATAESRGVALALAPEPGPLHVTADPTRLEQVFENLLDNASKFTPRGGHVEVRLETEPAGSGADVVSVHVRDDGRGMDGEVRARAFELFYQADRTPARSSGGLGIGLTLVRRLVEAHGGAVDAFSAGPGLGSEFTVRLPRAEAPRPAPPEPPAGTPAGGGRRVLIVDDNVDTAVSLATLLHMEGHEVRTAHDGVTALELAVETRPEVVLLDIGLPGMDGFELARQLRRRAETREALIVAITGYGRREDRERSREAGFDAHLVKPVDLDVLRGLLAEPAHRA